MPQNSLLSKTLWNLEGNLCNRHQSAYNTVQVSQDPNPDTLQPAPDAAFQSLRLKGLGGGVFWGFGFSRSHYVAVALVDLEFTSVGQTGLEPTTICLPLPREFWQ